jgi:hypothetical protein
VEWKRDRWRKSGRGPKILRAMRGREDSTYRSEMTNEGTILKGGSEIGWDQWISGLVRQRGGCEGGKLFQKFVKSSAKLRLAAASRDYADCMTIIGLLGVK